jgi:aminotransferase
MLTAILEGVGFVCYPPQGAYYIMTDVSSFGFANDVAFVRHLVTEIGVAAVPGSSFFRASADDQQYVRFCFCKTPETLAAAAERLQALCGRGCLKP